MIRPGIRRLFRLARWRRSSERDVGEEIRTHLELRAQELMRLGFTAAKAKAEALRRFGSLADATRELQYAANQREQSMRFRERMESFAQDVRYAMRGLRREPAFAAFVVVILALGIGANAAMFGIVDRLLLQGPEHVQNPKQLARFYEKVQPRGMKEQQYGTFGYVMYDILKRSAISFSGVSAYTIGTNSIAMGHGENARLLNLGQSTADFFPLLGVSAARGRFFTTTEDDVNSPEHVVVIGYGLWQRDFGGSDDVVGQSIVLAEEPYKIIGVAPKGFTGPELARVDVWMPLSIRARSIVTDWTHSWNWKSLAVIGRLKPETSAAQASSDATLAYHRGYTGDDSAGMRATIGVAPISFTRDGFESAEFPVSRWLVGVAAIVLLIACSNVINLLFARAVRRRREVAVRLALGAGRGRLIRLLLTEGMLLALCGGVVGLGVALVTGGFIRSVLLPNVEWTASSINGRVLLLLAAVSLVVGVVVALMPALQASRPDLTSALKSGARDGGGHGMRLRAVLTIAQAALSVVLLVGAGLFVVSLRQIHALDLGIQPDRVLVVDIRWQQASAIRDPVERVTEQARRENVFPAALNRVRALSGVERASLAVGLPFGSAFGQGMRVQGLDSTPLLNGQGPELSAVSTGYFETVGTRILSGRAFTDADRKGSEPVAIVSTMMANTAWPGKDPIGQCIFTGDLRTAPCARVVGISADTRRRGLREEPSMHYYLPFGQETGIGGTELLVRPRGDPAVVAEQIRRELTKLDPSISLVETDMLQTVVDSQIRPWTLGASMFSLMGVLALIVAATGLYSMMSYLIAQRTHEIGVRIALGAQSQDIVALVVGNSLGMAAVGVILGLGLSLASGRFLAPLLFDMSPRSPVVLASVAATLIGVALLASVVPALRANRVDPMVALRTE